MAVPSPLTGEFGVFFRKREQLLAAPFAWEESGGIHCIFLCTRVKIITFLLHTAGSSAIFNA